MGHDTRFARPLGWVVDLDLRGPEEIRRTAIALCRLRPPDICSYHDVAIVLEQELDRLKANPPQSNVLHRQWYAQRLRSLPRQIGVCRGRTDDLSLRGVALMVESRLTFAKLARILRLTTDKRVLERAGVPFEMVEFIRWSRETGDRISKP